MKKRTLKAGQFQRHYATNGILMYRERNKRIDVPEGTLITILKPRRQTHLASVRCVADADGNLTLGSGKRADDICIAVPTDFLPKLKIEGVETKAAAKGKKGGKKNTPAVVVAGEVGEQPAGIGAADLQGAEQAPVAEAAPAVEAPQENPAPAENPAPVVEEAPVPAEQPAVAEQAV